MKMANGGTNVGIVQAKALVVMIAEKTFVVACIQKTMFAVTYVLEKAAIG